MSLILDNISLSAKAVPEDNREYELDHIDRYLEILENNKKASQFVPDDAAVALDMATFVRERLGKNSAQNSISTARLALSLVQRGDVAPVQ